jgi:UPF0755 protein
MLQDLKDRENQKVLALVGILLLLVTLGLREIANRQSAYADYASGVSGPAVTVIVKEGASGEEIARSLDALDVIASWQSFFQIAIIDPRSKRIAPGTYRIDSRVPARQALEQLLDKGRIQGLITLRDGVRVAEVKEILKSLGYENVDQEIRATKVPDGFTGGSLEGFLYPARYSFEPNTSTARVIAAMVRRFESAIADLDLSSNPAGFTPDEVLTVASLIEAEGTPDVFAKISRVIFNRLERGLPLQLDASIHYIQGSRGEVSLTLKETQIQSRYNTYLNRGLPPGPIGSPTRAAILAALSPDQGDWIYFITVAPKETRFTASYEEFLTWKRLYRENYRNGLFND